MGASSFWTSIGYKILYFTIVTKGKQDAISIDKLKPVYLDLPLKNGTMEHFIPSPNNKVCEPLSTLINTSTNITAKSGRPVY